MQVPQRVPQWHCRMETQPKPGEVYSSTVCRRICWLFELHIDVYRVHSQEENFDCLAACSLCGLLGCAALAPLPSPAPPQSPKGGCTPEGQCRNIVSRQPQACPSMCGFCHGGLYRTDTNLCLPRSWCVKQGASFQRHAYPGHAHTTHSAQDLLTVLFRARG